MTETPPSGCHWCGIDQRTHFQRWHDTARWHRYVAPAQHLIKARMLARREAR
ncbi:hypothetical protein [Streptosporangium sp. NPDC049078]|uniref:hypothetical protein n=1 Tax=Streptosporangium sp. NPDC049078 TaxID=3155767 RepID=UPI0034440B14